MKKTLFSAIALGAMAMPAQATVVTSIKLTSALSTFIQVAEIVATQGGTGTNVALAGTATAANSYAPGYSDPFRVNDGVLGGNYFNPAQGIYHSAGTSADFLLLTLAAPTDLSSFTVYGRTDCCRERDLFIYTLFNDTSVVGTGSIDLRFSGNDIHGVTVDLPYTSGAVPEPASWAMMIAGFGLAGMAMRRRRATTVSFA